MPSVAPKNARFSPRQGSPKASSDNPDDAPAIPTWAPSAAAASESTLRHLVYVASTQTPEQSSGGPPPDPCAAQAAELTAAMAVLSPLVQAVLPLQKAYDDAEEKVGQAQIKYSAALLAAALARRGGPIPCAAAAAATTLVLNALQKADESRDFAKNTLRQAEHAVEKGRNRITRASQALDACRLQNLQN